jgi:pimeloyl-ACP methyl ester carboxylesterase
LGSYFVFQQGHAVERVHDQKVIKFFLDRGYDVIFIDMLLQNGNNRPTIGTPPFGKLMYRKHDQLKFLERPDFNPLKLFLEPVAATVNYAIAQTKPRQIAMVGLSGGGWITSLYAALDVRVTHSFPVAGTAPMYLRFALPERNWGDYEQTQPKLAAVASELDLYVMASSGNGRSQHQVFVLFDPCCYAGRYSQTYESHVKDTVAKLGGGRFAVWIDESTYEHEISNETLNKLHSVMEAS